MAREPVTTMSLVGRRTHIAPLAAPPEGADRAEAALDEVRSLFSRGMSAEAFAAFSRAREVVGWQRLTAAVAVGLAASYPKAIEGRASTQ